MQPPVEHISGCKVYIFPNSVSLIMMHLCFYSLIPGINPTVVLLFAPVWSGNNETVPFRL